MRRPTRDQVVAHWDSADWYEDYLGFDLVWEMDDFVNAVRRLMSSVWDLVLAEIEMNSEDDDE